MDVIIRIYIPQALHMLLICLFRDQVTLEDLKVQHQVNLRRQKQANTTYPRCAQWYFSFFFSFGESSSGLIERLLVH